MRIALLGLAALASSSCITEDGIRLNPDEWSIFWARTGGELGATGDDPRWAERSIDGDTWGVEATYYTYASSPPRPEPRPLPPPPRYEPPPPPLPEPEPEDPPPLEACRCAETGGERAWAGGNRPTPAPELELPPLDVRPAELPPAPERSTPPAEPPAPSQEIEGGVDAQVAGMLAAVTALLGALAARYGASATGAILALFRKSSEE